MTVCKQSGVLFQGRKASRRDVGCCVILNGEHPCFQTNRNENPFQQVNDSKNLVLYRIHLKNFWQAVYHTSINIILYPFIKSALRHFTLLYRQFVFPHLVLSKHQPYKHSPMI